MFEALAATIRDVGVREAFAPSSVGKHGKMASELPAAELLLVL